jgi:hypothetical protein
VSSAALWPNCTMSHTGAPLNSKKLPFFQAFAKPFSTTQV